MPYIGNRSTSNFSSIAKQDLTGATGSPAKRGFTLSHAVANANELEVFVNNVRQEPGVAYTVSNTTLTMTGDVETTDDFYVVFQGKAVQTTSHPSGSSLNASSGTFSGDLTVDTNLLFVDSSANEIGVGTTTPATYTDYVSGSNAPSIVVAGSQPSYVLADTDISGNDGTLGITKTGEDTVINNLGNGSIKFFNNGGERLTIDNSGTATFTEGDAITIIDRVGTNVAGIKTGAGDDFCVGTDAYPQAIRIKNNDGNVGIGTVAPSCQCHVKSDANNAIARIEANASTYTSDVIYVQTTKAASNTHNYFKANENGGSATSVQILGNGNVQNVNDSFGAISDERIKQDITDASSQWDDIKALKIKNFKLKYRVSVDGDDAPKHIGVVAQDLEAAGMNGLVETLEPDPYQKDTLGIEKDVRSVKYSILHMKAVKALQEAMARIETLETKVAALEAK